MLIVFDLDGTLIDSSEDLAASVNAMLTYLGRPRLSPEIIQSYVGNGATVLVQKALGAQSAEEVYERGLAFFLEHYSKHALDRTTLYPGIRELLEDLRSMDHRMAVLTNKPARISHDILNGLDAGKFFLRVYGGDSFKTRKPDPAGLLTLMGEVAVVARETLMVGDSPVDVQTAHSARVRCCGVLWGFQPHLVQNAAPEILIAKPHQLFAYV